MTTLDLRALASLLAGELSNNESSNHSAVGVRPIKVSASTKNLTPGTLFVAVRGFTADGHAFIDDAFGRGAVAAVVEDREALMGRPGIVVPNSRRALSILASHFAGYPSRELLTIGITGTNGKTTTNWIVYHLLNALDVGALRIGTLGTECMGKGTTEGSLTSPDPISLHNVMADAVAAGARACVMEASSHALDQCRVEDVEFDVGMFTNLTRDHLDYHGTMEAYFAAKSRLFELMAKGRKRSSAVINLDDRHGAVLRKRLAELGIDDWSFGRGQGAPIRIVSVSERSSGMQIALDIARLGKVFSFDVPLIGAHNAENIAAAVAGLLALGFDPDDVRRVAAQLPQVPGRLELVENAQPRVFVDYAHTPDALERACAALRPSVEGKLWVVFGCGGDRDKGKRPMMGEIARRCGDRVVVTSDNPRTEDPRAIIDDILASGITAEFVEPDRRAAIVQAISSAGPSDVVLVAGKGHEDYQIIGTEKIHFSDQEIAREALSKGTAAVR